MTAEVATHNGTLEVGRVQTLLGGIITARGYLYQVSADRQKFIVAQEDAKGAIPPLTLVQNRASGLGRK